MIIELGLINAVGMWLASGGYEDTRGILNDLFNINTAAIRGRARELYGTTDSRGDAEVPIFGWDLDPSNPVLTAGGDSPTALALMSAPEQALSSLLRTVQDRWRGPAYEMFEVYSQVLRDATQVEEARLRAMGDILVEFANAFEFTQHEVAGLCGQLAGIAGMAGGLIMAPPSGARSLAATAMGFVIKAVSALNTRVLSLRPRMEAVGSARLGIEQAEAPRSPLELLPAFPSDPGEWFVKTEDPIN